MKKYLIIIGLFLTMNNIVFGHTGYTDTVVCPVCGDSVVFHLTASMSTFGSFLDFQKQGAIGYYYEEMINTCKKCYYSGYHSDFDTTFTVSKIDSIKLLTNKYKDKKLDDALECEIAADIQMTSNYKYDQVASVYLISSYFLRTDSTQIDRRKEIQAKTADFFTMALKNNEYEQDVIATINYLIGEMYRRTGTFDKAIVYYDLAIKDKNKQDWVEDIAKQQKELATNKDENNEI